MHTLIIAMGLFLPIAVFTWRIYQKQLEPMEVVFPPKPYIRQLWEKFEHHDMWYEDFVWEFAQAVKPAIFDEAMSCTQTFRKIRW